MRLPRWLRWRTDRELREEIDAHLEIEMREQIDRGVPAHTARYAALRAFGNPGRMRELVREASPLYQLDLLGQDVGFALRLLRRTPLLAATIVTILVFGIGLNTTVFTILNAFLFRPLVSRDPATFAVVQASFSGQFSRSIHGSPFMLTLDEYEAFAADARSLAVLTASAPVSLTLGGDEPVDVRGQFVSCNFLSAHLDAPLLGRTFQPDECARAGSEPVAVLNERIWRSRFSADPSIVGRTILLNKHTFTVIGVAPNQLTLDVPPASIWIPFSLQPALRPSEDYFRRGSEDAWLDVWGRLAAGTTLSNLQAVLSTVATRLDRLFPGRQMHVRVYNGAHINGPFLSKASPVLVPLLIGSLGLVLLIVCANVTTLLLARAAGRRHEMAIRLSLGAGRGRLLRQLLTESLMLALTAGAASWWIAHHLPWALMSLSEDAPAEVSFAPDWRVFLFTFGAAMMAGCAAGLSPALESLRLDLFATLKPTGRTGDRAQTRIRGWLVAGQLAASVALLVAAALVVRAQGRLFAVNLGYDPATVVVTPLNLSHAGYDPGAARRFFDRLDERVRALPDVRATAISHDAVFRGQSSTTVTIPGDPQQRRVFFRRVSPGYFETYQIPFINGRAFTDAETHATVNSTPVVISRTLATTFWPDRDPLGQRLKHDRDLQVVGVVEDVSSMRLTEKDGPMLYEPMRSNARDGVLTVRSQTNAAPLATAIRSVTRELDPNLATSPETLSASIDRLAERYAFLIKVAWIPAGLALVLCVLGIYGIAAFAATQRTPEIGIRLAMGAQPSDIVKLLFRAISRPLWAGLLTGVALAVGLGFLMEKADLLVDVSPIDPVSHGIACAVVASAALAATFIPARRASRLDPWRAVRDE